MNTNPTSNSAESLSALLRRRRVELGLTQAQVAQELHISPEAVTHWESGRRRMDLSKVPGLAAALQIDPQELCARALSQFHPGFYATLFTDCGVA